MTENDALHEPSILVGDDDVPYTEDWKTILERRPYVPHVQIAHTGEEILKAASKPSNIRVLILDMMIPMNAKDSNGAMPPKHEEEPRGITVLRQLVDLGFELSRTVVITAFWDEKAISDVKQMGVKHVFLKPVDTRDILRTVHQLYFA